MARQAQSSQPTVRERLDKGGNLSSPISSQRLDSFAKFFPGTVGRDYSAGSDWGLLVRGLGQLDRGIGKSAQDIMDRHVAKWIAEGGEWARENPEITKNMEAFKELGLSNPEFQNKNPYVKRAIEAAILENQALQLKAEALDHYNTSGLRNERDASKVQSAMAEWTKDAIERSGLKNYNDPLLLAQYFEAPVRQMQETLLTQHNQDVERQNVNLLFEQASQEFDNLIFGQTNILNNGGKNINIPRDRATVNNVAIQALHGLTEKFTNLGMREDQIMPFLQAQVLSGKFTASQAEAIGKGLVFDRNGTQVSLASQPGFAKALSRLKDEEMDRAERREKMAAWRETRAREDAARNSANWGIKDAFNGKPLMLNLKERGLTNAMDIKAYQDAFNLANSVQFTSAYSTPGRAADALQFQFDLLTGAKGPADIISAASSGVMSPTEAQSFISIAAKNNSDEGRMISAAMQDVAEVTLADSLNITRSEASSLMQQGIKDLPEHISAAREQARAEAMNFYAAYEKEKEKAASGKDSYTALDITQLKQKHIASSSITRGNTAVEERAAKKSGDLTRGIIMGVGKKISPNFMQPAGAGVDVQFPGVSPLTERDQKITHVYQGALNTLNTLFPDWKTKAPEDPDALEKLHKDKFGNYRIDDLADMLMLGQGLYGKAFTADKAASIILGRVIPEDSMTKVQLQQAMEARITELNKLFRK